MVDRNPIHGVNTDDEFYGTASLIGDGPAGEFIAFKKSVDKMPDLDQIIANPTYTQVPDDPSVLFAASGALASRAEDNNFKEIMKHAKRTLSEYQVVLVRDSLAKDRDLETDAFRQWTQDNANVLIYRI